MVRLFFRFIGLLLLAGAFVALVVDGTRSLGAGTVAIVPFGRTSSAMFPDAFAKLHQAVQTHVPLLWDPVLVTLFLLPTWLILGGFGIMVFASTRRRAAKIGYSRR